MHNYHTMWEKCKNRIYMDDINEIDSTTKSDIELPARNLSQRWRRYGHDAKRRVFERFSKWCPKGTATSNLFIYLKTDQTFPEFVLKSVIGFFGGIVLTYFCFIFFVSQLSISLIHATIMSSVIGVLLTFGLAFSYRIRCLVFLLIPQLFSRVGRYSLTCYALVLILTGPATNTLKNSEVLTESMACTQEQIKMDVKQITDSLKKPFGSMRDTIKLMIRRLNEIAYKVDEILSKINKLVISIVEVLQSSYIWLYKVNNKCNEKFKTPYEHCIKVLTCDAARRNEIRKYSEKVLHNNSFTVKAVCSGVHSNTKIFNAPEYVEESVAATIKRNLRKFINRVKANFFIKINIHHSQTLSTNSSHSPGQVTAGIVTEIRNRADLLLTWLSWSSCITSLFLLLIIFRAKYYQHMFETRSRFDNRYITKELRVIDLQRSLEGKETVLPLNRREQAKYVTTTSFRLVATEKVNLTRSIVFMTITTFKLMIHMIADYSLYWVLTTIRYHGKRQTQLPPGPMDAGLHITGTGLIADLVKSIFKVLMTPISESSSPMSCLPEPHPPNLKRYAQIGVLIFLLWFFALFEPYGLRLRHLIMGHYRPERAKARAAWLYNHILRTRGSFMKFARRKLHKEFKYFPEEKLTFRFWLRNWIPFRWLRCCLGIAPLDPKCLLCNAKEVENIPNSELIRCETPNCPGTYCKSCFTDIGRLCTICLSPEDYGDLSDISLEKGSSEDSEDGSLCTDTTNLLAKRKYFIGSNKSRDKKSNLNFLNQNNEINHKTPLLYSPEEETRGDNNYNKYLITNSLDFTNFSAPKNSVSVGYVYHNYFYNNNVNIPPNIFENYDVINKDYVRNSNRNFRVSYGAIDKTLDKLELNEIKLVRVEQFNRPENKTILTKEKIVSTVEPNNIATNNNVKINQIQSINRINSKSARVKKNTADLLQPQSKSFRIKHKYLRKKHSQSNRVLFSCVKRKMSNILSYIKTPITESSIKIPVTGMSSMNSDNMKFNLYNVKKSSTFIAVSKISLNKKVRYCRKGTRYKTNVLHNKRINNTSDSNLHENNKPNTKNNTTLNNKVVVDKDINDNDKKDISDKNKKLSKRRRNKKHSYTCFSTRKIREIFSNYILTKCISKKISYSNKNSKRKREYYLKTQPNYKRRKKSAYQKMTKENGQNKSDKTNNIEATRKYRIYAFLREGDWLKGQSGEELSDNKERGNKNETVKHDVYCVGVKRIRSTHVQKANKHFSCTCITKGISGSVNALDLQLDNKYSENWVPEAKTHLSCTCIRKGISGSSNALDLKLDNMCSGNSVYHCLPVLSKSHSQANKENMILGHLKLSPSSVKSFSIKNVKSYITKKFLHFKFGSPISLLKTLFSTISFTKENISTCAKIHQENRINCIVDKSIDATPVIKSCKCHCEITKDSSQRNPNLYYLDGYRKVRFRHNEDKQTQTMIQACTCATQYSTEDKTQVDYDHFIRDLYKGYEHKTNKEIKPSDATRLDTSLGNNVGIDYIDETARLKDKVIKKIKVITKSYQSTATDMSNLCNASTSSDWWSPIMEKKKFYYKKGK